MSSLHTVGFATDNYTPAMGGTHNPTVQFNKINL